MPTTPLWVTQAADLLCCARSAWMAIRSEYEWLSHPLNEAQALGIVSHSLIERVDRGEFDSLTPVERERHVEASWNQACEEIFLNMKVQSIIGEPPKPERWPFFYLRMSFIIDRALSRHPVQFSETASVRSMTEALFEDSELGLTGRADRVDIRPDGVSIVDHKMSSGHGNLFPERYRNQLLLYCLLYRHKNNVTPRSIIIQWGDGTSVEEDVNDGVLDALWQSFSELRSSLDREDPPLGRPSDDNCRYCDYRVLCPDYAAAEKADWLHHPHCFSGQITNVITSESSSTATLQVTSKLEGSRSVVIRGLPLSLDVKSKSTLVVDRLRHVVGGDTFEVLWSSRVKVYESD